MTAGAPISNPDRFTARAIFLAFSAKFLPGLKRPPSPLPPLVTAETRLTGLCRAYTRTEEHPKNAPNERRIRKRNAARCRMIRINPMKAPTRFPGIASHARFLGVSMSHLYRCLMGERKMARDLQMRYDSLLEEERINTEIESQISAARIPFDRHFIRCNATKEQIKEVLAEFGDAVRIIGGNKIVFDATRVHLHRVNGDTRAYALPARDDDRGAKLSGRTHAAPISA